MKRSKLKLNRETLTTLGRNQARAVGANCTCSCCYTDCNCPEPTFSCDTCGCPTDQASVCICI